MLPRRAALRRFPTRFAEMDIPDSCAIQRAWVALELAFVLGKPLRGPGATLFDVVSTEAGSPR